MSSAAAFRRQLVHELAIADARVRDAFLRVPRELFVPEFHAEHGLAISSSSQPRIMAAMLERLELEPGLRVLEIGAGTGYNAALLKTVVGRRGRVVSVDVDAAIHGIGVVGRGGRSLALVEGRREQRDRPSPQRLAAWGEPEAEGVLRRAVERRQERGRPAEAKLRLTVAFDGGTSRVSRRWTR